MFYFYIFQTRQSKTIEAVRAKVHHWPNSFEDGLVVYPANAFDSRLRGDQLGTDWFKSEIISKRPQYPLTLATVCALSTTSIMPSSKPVDIQP